MEERFTVKKMHRQDRWSVKDNETGFKIIFTLGDWNNSQTVIQPKTLPEGVNSDNVAQWAARAMREIGDYMAAEHPELLWPTQEAIKQSEEDAETRKKRFYDVTADIGRSLAELRQYYGLSAEEAAQRAELSVKKLEAIERGVFTANLSSFCRIVEALGGRLAVVPEETPDDPHCQFIEFEE